MGGQRSLEERRVCTDLSSRVSLTSTKRNWLKPQCAKFSPLALPVGWGGNCPHLLRGELWGAVSSPSQEQNLQDLGHCCYLALGVAGKAF